MRSFVPAALAMRASRAAAKPWPANSRSPASSSLRSVSWGSRLATGGSLKLRVLAVRGPRRQAGRRPARQLARGRRLRGDRQIQLQADVPAGVELGGQAAVLG